MRTYADAAAEPLTTHLALERRVGELVGNAIRPQLWLMFLDLDAVQLPLLIPIDGLPVEPASVLRLAPAVTEVFRITEAASIVFVLERPGPATPSDIDREWARSLRELCEEAALPSRGVFLSHDDGVLSL